jgi:hypothetical protein
VEIAEAIAGLRIATETVGKVLKALPASAFQLDGAADRAEATAALGRIEDEVDTLSRAVAYGYGHGAPSGRPGRVVVPLRPESF